MRGIIFSASGERYVGAALKAAERSRSWNDVPHTIFCTHPCSAAGIETIDFRSRGNPYIDKISNLLASPYDETLYLDVDCSCVDRVLELFDTLQHYDLAAAHAPGYRGAPDPEVPAAFYEINTGVLVYRRIARITNLVEQWRSTYEAWLASPPFKGADGLVLGQDQPAFRHCLWHSGIPICVIGPEYNWRILGPSFLCGKVKIIHGFVSDPDALAAKVNNYQGPRTFPAFSRGYGIDSEIDAQQVAKIFANTL
jgi:hypothetical protein